MSDTPETDKAALGPRELLLRHAKDMERHRNILREALARLVMHYKPAHPLHCYERQAWEDAEEAMNWSNEPEESE